MNFIVGSAVPYILPDDIGKDPTFQVAYLDPDTLLPLDVETFTFDLQKANKQPDGKPEWYKAYSMKQAYNLKDLSPQSFLDFANDIYVNETAAQVFGSHWRAGRGDAREPCGYECRLYYHCMAVTADYDEYQYCTNQDLKVYSPFET